MPELTKDIIWEYMRDTEGWVESRDIDRDLSLATQSVKSKRRVYLVRLVEEKKLKRHPSKNGVFRCVDGLAPELDWESGVEDEPLDIKWPFDLENLVEIYSKNLIVIAGNPNEGKTAFCLNVGALNMDTWPVIYYSSEMGEQELGKRLRKFDGIPEWKVKFKERSANFSDVIEPDAINIIDYLEIEDNFYLVGRELSHIYRELDKGIAVVALQKNPNAKTGVGGRFSLDRPRLYLTMDSNKLTIIKAKNWANELVNPNQKTWAFKLLKGCKFLNLGEV